jgi:hypothetical protein
MQSKYNKIIDTGSNRRNWYGLCTDQWNRLIRNDSLLQTNNAEESDRNVPVWAYTLKRLWGPEQSQGQCDLLQWRILILTLCQLRQTTAICDQATDAPCLHWRFSWFPSVLRTSAKVPPYNRPTSLISWYPRWMNNSPIGNRSCDVWPWGQYCRLHNETAMQGIWQRSCVQALLTGPRQGFADTELNIYQPITLLHISFASTSAFWKLWQTQ